MFAGIDIVIHLCRCCSGFPGAARILRAADKFPVFACPLRAEAFPACGAKFSRYFLPLAVDDGDLFLVGELGQKG